MLLFSSYRIGFVFPNCRRAKIGKFIHDYEIDAEENPEKVKFKETLGLCYVLKGMEKTSKTDDEIVEKGLVVLDALYASFTDYLRFP
jgi:hypothetical protein